MSLSKEWKGTGAKTWNVLLTNASPHQIRKIGKIEYSGYFQLDSWLLFQAAFLNQMLILYYEINFI